MGRALLLFIRDHGCAPAACAGLSGRAAAALPCHFPLRPQPCHHRRSLENRLFDGTQSGVGIARLERLERALLRDGPISTLAATATATAATATAATATAAAASFAGRDSSRSLRSGPTPSSVSRSSFAERVAAVEAAASLLHYGVFEVHKGLQNQRGANNCFLNAALQALWHSQVRTTCDGIYQCGDNHQIKCLLLRSRCAPCAPGS